jgi:outer membrane protein
MVNGRMPEKERKVNCKRQSAIHVCFLCSVSCIFLLSGCIGSANYDYERVKMNEQARATLSNIREPRITQPSHAPGGVISMDQAILTALEANPDTRMAMARIRQAHAVIDEANAAFWPRISFYGEYLQGDSPSTYLFKAIDQRKLPQGVDFNAPGWFENYEAGFQVRLNLFRGGRDLLHRRMAETGLRIHELGRLSIENALVESVIHAYFQSLAARDYVEIAKHSVHTVAEQKRVVEVRYRAGGALKSDLLSLKVRFAQANEELVQAENNYALSIAALAILLNLDPDIPLQVEEKQGINPEFPEDYASGLIHALAGRPELEKTRRQVVQSYMALDVARSQYLPTIDVNAGFYVDDSDARFDTSRDNWTAAVILNWDVFTGLSTRAKVEKAGSALDEMLALDRKAIQTIQLELKSAYLALAGAKARIEVSRASVAQAEETLSLVKKEYEGGSATITRYLEAELALSRTRIQAMAAYYDKQKSLASVGRAIGHWVSYAEGVRGENEKR